jgi:hypothetical protein
VRHPSGLSCGKEDCRGQDAILWVLRASYKPVLQSLRSLRNILITPGPQIFEATNTSWEAEFHPV